MRSMYYAYAHGRIFRGVWGVPTSPRYGVGEHPPENVDIPQKMLTPPKFDRKE